jgi:hypothetical protein
MGIERGRCFGSMTLQFAKQRSQYAGIQHSIRVAANVRAMPGSAGEVEHVVGHPEEIVRRRALAQQSNHRLLKWKSVT